MNFPWYFVTEPGLLPPDVQSTLWLCALIVLIWIAGVSAWRLGKEIMK